MESNLQAVDAIIDQWGAKPESLLQIMLDVNHHFNYLPRESFERISKRLRMPISQVYSVATFFKVFSLKPRGRTIVHVCTGTACHVKGAPKILDRMKQDLGLKLGAIFIE
ncbi:MAG: NAD(P)H-dependent oxidoreductase subunit E [Thermodesulfobacteriota bacterium]|nr:NAD(P)H-dependent oxidoreductase subunit E [Thermodesulfobacteriota bacterium]